MIKDNQETLNKLHIVTDAALIVFAFMIAYPIRFNLLASVGPFALGAHEKYLSFAEYCGLIVYLVPGYLLIYNFCGLYNPKRGRRRIRMVSNLIEANLLGTFYYAFLMYIMKVQDISRWFYLIFAFINFVFGIAFRLGLLRVLRSIRKRGYNLKHVLMVGYSRSCEGYIDRCLANPDWGFKIHGILDDNKDTSVSYRDIPVLGKTTDLEEIIAPNDYDEIVITLDLSEYYKLEGIVSVCEKSGLHTKFVPDYNTMVSTVPYIEDVYGLPVINIRNVPLTNLLNMFVKRLCDIVIGLLALVVFAIPMIVTAIIIKCTDRGPIFYSQVRVGKHNKEFKMYKFRSMRVQDPEKEKSGWTTKGDPRITPIGRFIRKTSIDELPQIFNVLMGQMSLVGPRPERPQFVEKFKEEIPRYMVKHQVRPGMTGWAQVNGYRGDTSIKKRIECDLYYIENWTLGLDFRIMFLTIFKGFVNKNAY